MERILTSEQMRAADKFTIENLGVSEEELIERAGLAIVDEILKRFQGGRVLVCIGKGNNGKDGLVVTRELSKRHGFTVATINVTNGIFKLFDKKYDIIVDCIFGTGLNREIDGKYKKAIEKINNSGAYVISCDIPSGINGNNGLIMGVAVKANLTIAIQEYKLGHFLNDGIDYSGEVVAKDIGISIWGEDFVMRHNIKSLVKFFASRPRNSHKGNYGKCAIIGGSKKYSGSVLLSSYALSAFKTGVGYVNVVVPESMFSSYVGKVPECILTPMNDIDGFMQLDCGVLNQLLDYDSISVGMGMGDGLGTYEIIKYLLNNYKGNLLIDADGLNALSIYGSNVLSETSCNVIITPHVGEFCKLASVSKDEVLEKPIDLSLDYSRRNNIILLLKNAVSVICDGECVFINTTGCSGMAKAGSGDILSGLATGLLARCDNLDVLETVAAAAYIFGLAGELACKEQNNFTVTASDIIKALPKAIDIII